MNPLPNLWERELCPMLYDLSKQFLALSLYKVYIAFINLSLKLFL